MPDRPPGDAALSTLAGLLPCGVLVLDADAMPLFASAKACALLDCADAAQLRARWDALAPRLGLDAGSLRNGAQPKAPRRHARNGAAGALRVETHAVDTGGATHRLVLLQRRDRAVEGDTLLIEASRANSQQHRLAGLLHDLNAPLNNLNLTLALLAGTLARVGAQADDAALERCRRHVDVLNAETRRLSECARSMNAAVVPAEPSTGVAPVGALLQDVHHALRHHATLLEVQLVLDAPAADLCTRGDIDLLRLALLELAVTAIGITATGGRVVVTPRRQDHEVHVALVASPARASTPIERSAAAVLAAPDAAWLGFAAARRIVETHGGRATLRASAADALTIEAHLPLHRA